MTTIHGGHRQRMRQRYQAQGLEGFAPHEVLELLLFYTRPRGDVNPLAHALLDEFGSLHGVLEASPEQLMCVKGVGEETATLLSMIVPILRRYQTSRATERLVLANNREGERFCVSLLAGLRSERLCALLMDGYCRLLGVKTLYDGGIDAVQFHPRKVVEVALNHNAKQVIICHNHPGGTLLPSRADLESTKQIQNALEGVGIRLTDHVIVAGDKTYSMCDHGDLINM